LDGRSNLLQDFPHEDEYDQHVLLLIRFVPLVVEAVELPPLLPFI